MTMATLQPENGKRKEKKKRIGSVYARMSAESKDIRKKILATTNLEFDKR